MTWINKGLQINPGSYGVLRINANSEPGCMHGIDFMMTIYSYIDCGGKHDHNNFSFGTPSKAIKAAEILYHFATTRKRLNQECFFELDQQYKQRGKFYLIIDKNNKLTISIGTYAGSSYSGNLTVTKKQAKKIAGYLFFWAGEVLIGKRKVKHPASVSYVFDARDEG